MSTKYKLGADVPTETLCTRLDELTDALINRKDRDWEAELTMRIPAECDRDADLVISETAARLRRQDARIAELEAQNESLRDGVTSVRCLIDCSEGVAGLHLNGDVAEWDSLLEGGSFESWLLAFNEAEDSINPDESRRDIPGFESTLDDLERLNIKGGRS